MSADAILRDRLLAILAADVAGYSRLMSLDSRATLTALDGARAVFRAHVAAQGGRIVDMAGDSVLAVFETAAAAVQAALAIQQALAQSSGDGPTDRRMQFRIGVHVGDVLEKPDGTVYGDGVNIAARLESLAQPGGVAISNAVHELVSGRVTADFQDLGEQRVKNIQRPVRAWGLGFVAARTAPRLSRSLIAVAAALALGLGLALSFWWLNSQRTAQVQAPPGSRIRATLAVAAFSSTDRQAVGQQFALGLGQGVLGLLSRVPDLRVFSAAAAASANSSTRSEYVVDGEVVVTGTQAHIRTFLRQVSDGLTLWNETYVRELKDTLSVQEEVAFRVASAIDLKLEEISPVARGTHSLQAWELYRQASAMSKIEAIEPVIRRALTLDPKFARAHVLLAERMLQYRSQLGTKDMSREERLKLLREAVGSELQAAMSTNPQLPDIYLARSDLELDVNSDAAAAFESVQRALQVQPHSSAAHFKIAQLYLRDGRMYEALSEARRSLELAPTRIGPLWLYAAALRWAGRPADALQQIDRAVLLEPNFAPFQEERIRVLLDLGRREEAVNMAGRIMGTNDGWNPIYVLGVTGYRRELEKLSNSAKASQEDRAFASLLLGDKKPMLALLASEGSPTRVYFKLWDASFDGLRDEPEFKSWLWRHRLTEAHARAQDWRASLLRPASAGPQASASKTAAR